MSSAVATSLLGAVDEVAPAGPNGARLVSARIFDHALASVPPSSPRPAVGLALSGLLEILLGFGEAFLRSVIDSRIRTAAVVNQVLGAPVSAAVGKTEAIDRNAKLAAKAQLENAKGYRRLLTKVGFFGLGGERRLHTVITSGESLLLIDADLRLPQVVAWTRLGSGYGLSDVLAGRESLQDQASCKLRGGSIATSADPMAAEFFAVVSL